MSDLLNKISPKIMKYDVRNCSFLLPNDENKLVILFKYYSQTKFNMNLMFVSGLPFKYQSLL